MRNKISLLRIEMPRNSTRRRLNVRSEEFVPAHVQRQRNANEFEELMAMIHSMQRRNQAPRSKSKSKSKSRSRSRGGGKTRKN
jgi:hypothetical protein